MGFKSVYQCLTDVFPQIDSRLLRAVAIENSKSADAAVEVVLSEILPNLSKREMIPNARIVEGDVLSNTRIVSSDGEAELEEQQKSGLRHRRVSLVKHVGASSEPRSVAKDDASGVDLAKKLDSSVVLPSDAEVDTDQLKGTLESEEVILLEVPQREAVNSLPETRLISEVMTETEMLIPENNSNEKQVLNMMASSLSECKQADIKVGDGLIPQDMSRLENDGSSGSSISHHVERNDFAGTSGNDLDASVCGGENSQVESSVLDTTLEVEESSVVPVHESTKSKQENKVDLLEEIIEAAKNNKKTLFLAMESVMNMMRKVELEEQAAEHAKEEAARGGLDIWHKVEEIKEMLAHAKEGNNMHAGEVYGEKAILATEVRELQARLLSLSEERDKALAVLDEMHQTLEGRLAAAEELRKAAEKEKLEKEESALKALAEQQAIMDKVVQESKILLQEAEENSKLREFLMDRGHVVDMLQGEISVICQDVLLLKEKFDDRVPLSKSISSSQTSCILASSGSSFKSMAASDHQMEETSKNLKEVSPASSADGQSPKRILEGENNVVDSRDPLEEGWEFFEGNV